MFGADRRVAGEKRRPQLIERGDDARLHRIGAQKRNEPRDARFVQDPMDRRWANCRYAVTRCFEIIDVIADFGTKPTIRSTA